MYQNPYVSGKVVNTVEELIGALETNFEVDRKSPRYVPSYFYYTTISGLKAMLENNKFRLSNITNARMNDLLEPKDIGKSNAWSRTCIGCFSADRMENNAMWKAYGNPEDEAIIIRIPSRVMEAMKKADVYVERNVIDLDDARRLEKVEGVEVSHHGIAYLQDVHYVEDEEGRKRSASVQFYRDYSLIAEIPVKGFDAKRLEPLMGYVKRWPWMYEREARLQLALPAKYAKANAYIELPREFFKKVSIVLGPHFDVRKENNQKVLKSFLEKNTSIEKGREPLVVSAYYGRLNYGKTDSSAKNRMPDVIHDKKKVSRQSAQGEPLVEKLFRLKCEKED